MGEKGPKQTLKDDMTVSVASGDIEVTPEGKVVYNEKSKVQVKNGKVVQKDEKEKDEKEQNLDE